MYRILRRRYLRSTPTIAIQSVEEEADVVHVLGLTLFP